MGGVAVENTATKSIVTFNVEEGGVLSEEQLRFKKSVCRGLVNCNAFEQHMISLRDFESYPGSETHSYEVTTPMVFVQNQIACVIPFTMVKGTVEGSSINWRVGGQQCWNSNGKLYCKCAGLSDKWLSLGRPTSLALAGLRGFSNHDDEYIYAKIESTSLPECSPHIHPPRRQCYGHIKHAATRQLVFESRRKPGDNFFTICEAILRDEDGIQLKMLQGTSTGMYHGTSESSAYDGTRSSSWNNCAAVDKTTTGTSRLTLNFESGREPKWLEVFPRSDCTNCNKERLGDVDVYLDGVQVNTLIGTDKATTYSLKRIHELVFENADSKYFTLCEVELRNANSQELPILLTNSTGMFAGTNASFVHDGNTDGTDVLRCSHLDSPSTGPAQLRISFLGELSSVKIYPRTDWAGAKDRLQHVKVKLDGVEIGALIGSNEPVTYHLGKVTLSMNPENPHGFALCEFNVFDSDLNKITLSNPFTGQIYRGTPNGLIDGSDSTCLHLSHTDTTTIGRPTISTHFHPPRLSFTQV
uniref:Uncharacterized protein n=1 Tax=Mucochytrium quahogii TaxID=96639 RepID=A0A7S2SBI4_9STRA